MSAASSNAPSQGPSRMNVGALLDSYYEITKEHLHSESRDDRSVPHETVEKVTSVDNLGRLQREGSGANKSAELKKANGSSAGDNVERMKSSGTSAASRVLDLDDWNFDVNKYFQSVVETKSLPEVLKETNRLKTESKSLSGDMQSLVYENYNKFISITDTVRLMKRKIESAKGKLHSLEEMMGAIEDCSNKLEDSIADRANQIEELVSIRNLITRLQLVIRLPWNMSKSMKIGECKEALQQHIRCIPFLRRHHEMPRMSQLSLESDALGRQCLDKLVEMLRCNSYDLDNESTDTKGSSVEKFSSESHDSIIPCAKSHEICAVLLKYISFQKTEFIEGNETPRNKLFDELEADFWLNLLKLFLSTQKKYLFKQIGEIVNSDYASAVSRRGTAVTNIGSPRFSSSCSFSRKDVGPSAFRRATDSIGEVVVPQIVSVVEKAPTCFLPAAQEYYRDLNSESPNRDASEQINEMLEEFVGSILSHMWESLILFAFKEIASSKELSLEATDILEKLDSIIECANEGTSANTSTTIPLNGFPSAPYRPPPPPPPHAEIVTTATPNTGVSCSATSSTDNFITAVSLLQIVRGVNALRVSLQRLHALQPNRLASGFADFIVKIGKAVITMRFVAAFRKIIFHLHALQRCTLQMITSQAEMVSNFLGKLSHSSATTSNWMNKVMTCVRSILLEGCHVITECEELISCLTGPECNASRLKLSSFCASLIPIFFEVLNSCLLLRSGHFVVQKDNRFIGRRIKPLSLLQCSCSVESLSTKMAEYTDEGGVAAVVEMDQKMVLNFAAEIISVMEMSLPWPDLVLEDGDKEDISEHREGMFLSFVRISRHLELKGIDRLCNMADGLLRDETASGGEGVPAVTKNDILSMAKRVKQVAQCCLRRYILNKGFRLGLLLEGCASMCSLPQTASYGCEEPTAIHGAIELALRAIYSIHVELSEFLGESKKTIASFCSRTKDGSRMPPGLVRSTRQRSPLLAERIQGSDFWTIQRMLAKKADTFPIISEILFNGQLTIVSILRIALMNFVEYIREKYYNVYGVQQLQLDCAFLSEMLRDIVEKEEDLCTIDVMLDEAIMSACCRCFKVTEEAELRKRKNSGGDSQSEEILFSGGPNMPTQYCESGVSSSNHFFDTLFIDSHVLSSICDQKRSRFTFYD